MKVKVEAIFWFELDLPSIGEAENMINDIRIKNPQSAETIAPQYVGAWKMGTELADVDPIGAAVVRVDAGPKRGRDDEGS